MSLRNVITIGFGLIVAASAINLAVVYDFHINRRTAATAV